MDSPHTDPHRSEWLRWASESDRTPVFIRTVAKAIPIACSKRMADLLLVS